MVSYRSTANGASGVSFRQALFQGLAPDGGLYVPERVPALALEPLRGMDFVARARGALGAWLNAEIGADATAALCREAFDFPVPLARLDADTWLLELFHGPTGAFKDFGARFMARALWRLRPPGRRLTLLVATSGDTGSAVAHAFAGLSDTRVVLLYPAGKVSSMQESQLLAVPANVHAVRVGGTFDDCQAMVKAALHDHDLAGELGLVSANSINIGRLLPQITYYVHACLEMDSVRGPGRSAGQPARRSAALPLVVVPSGNLGNLTAGLLAKRSGVPIDRFVAAANRNDVFPRYLESGTLRPKPAVPTPSNAMDVGDPSNAARIRALYADRLEDLRRDVLGEAVDDEETLRTIRATFDSTGRFVCPHTAVGLAARRRHPKARPAVVLATADPGKFAEIMERATGQAPEPPLSDRPEHSARRVPTDMAPDPSALREYLRGKR